MPTTYTIDLSACCCGINCATLPALLYGSVTGPDCGICVGNTSLTMAHNGVDPCAWDDSSGPGELDLCPAAGFGFKIAYDGTNWVASNPGGYCGPPTMTFTPDSLHPFHAVITWNVADGNNCAPCSGTMSVTVTE